MKTTICSTFAILIAFALPTASLAEGGGSNIPTFTLKVKGHACHGANIFNSELLSDYVNTQSFLPPDVFAFWNGFMLPEVGVFNSDPDATDGSTIDANTPLDSVMATIALPGYSALAPGFDPASLNVPIHDAFIEADAVTSARARLPVATLDVSKLEPVRNVVMQDPITLEQWNSVRGDVRLGCYADGSGFASIDARNLIPHLAYTTWQVFAVTDDQSAVLGPIVGYPLGGAPNYLVADEKGRARYSRQLNYCPLDTDENPLMYIALLAHWDHGLYGATPDGFGNGWPAGPVAADHLCFPTGNHLLEAVSGDDEDSDSDSD